MNRKSIIALSLVIFFSVSVSAEDGPVEPKAEAETEAAALADIKKDHQAGEETANSKGTYIERVGEREARVTSVAYESVNPENQPHREDRWSDFLPILGKEAREQGYVLPLPFGISIVGLQQKQPFDVTRIALAYKGKENESINNAIDNTIAAKNLSITSTSYNFRFDAWIFPFFNVYGILGRSDVKAKLQLDVDAPLPIPLLIAGDIGSGLGSQRCDSLGLPYRGTTTPANCQLRVDNIPVLLNIEGDTVGAGMTLAGGYGDFFGMLDMNYSESDLNISTTKAEAVVTSARLGWNGSMGVWSGSMWVGAMHQDIEQTLTLALPGTELSVVIDQEVRSPVNYLLGGRWNFSEEWELMAETNAGFADRQQFMLQISYRM